MLSFQECVIGHCLLNQSMARTGKHQTGYCDKCRSENMETVEHVLLKCEAYERETFKLFQALREIEVFFYQSIIREWVKAI